MSIENECFMRQSVLRGLASADLDRKPSNGTLPMERKATLPKSLALR